MEITVISEEENPMLHRTDVRFRVSHAEATPDRLAVRDSLAARLNKNADEVVVRKLDTKFGMRETIGEAKVYQGADFAKDVEQDHMLVRNKIGEHVEEAAAEPEDEASQPDVEAEDEDEATEEAETGEADAEDEASEPAVEEEPAEEDEEPAEEAEVADSEADETAAEDEAADAESEDEADEETEE